MPPDETGHVLIGHSQIPYSIRRSKRRRRSFGLLVGRGEIHVLAPARAGIGAIERLLRRQTEWIGRRLDRLSREPGACVLPRSFIPGAPVFYRGESFTLRITGNSTWPQGCMIEGNELVVNLTGEVLTGAAQAEETRLEIMLWYKKEARRVFAEHTDYWAEKTGLRYRRLTVSNARRQWGSCSAGNDVRLNWRLILVPPALLDYVIVHELCHIRHKNHSPRFWALVEFFIPGCKAIRKELRKIDAGMGM